MNLAFNIYKQGIFKNCNVIFDQNVWESKLFPTKILSLSFKSCPFKKNSKFQKMLFIVVL